MNSRRDEGAGSALALALVAVLVLLAIGCLPVGAVLVAKHRAAGAADAAALAAADVLLGAATGVPCDRAAQVVAVDLVLLSCRTDGGEARVQVRAEVLRIEISAVARAGPAPVSGAGGGLDSGVYGVP